VPPSYARFRRVLELPPTTTTTARRRPLRMGAEGSKTSVSASRKARRVAIFYRSEAPS
jgi:hypothetical protein